MAKRTKSKVKSMSPEKVAQREERRWQEAVNDIGAAIGMPEAQRNPKTVQLATTAIVDGYSRPMSKTLRKLTPVDRLRKAGVLEFHEAEACEDYASIMARAWDTVGCTANYSGMGSGNYSDAAKRAHRQTEDQIEARANYWFARSALPEQYVPVFEAVICHNATIANIAGEKFSALGRSQREHKTRAIIKLCANLLHGAVGNRLTVR
jgi:hypothetical protein